MLPTKIDAAHVNYLAGTAADIFARERCFYEPTVAARYIDQLTFDFNNVADAGPVKPFGNGFVCRNDVQVCGRAVDFVPRNAGLFACGSMQKTASLRELEFIQ